MDDIALLINKKITTDSTGNEIAVESTTEIFVNKEAINRAEFFNAARSGMKADIKLTTCLLNYDGQNEIEFCGKRYAIYRTFVKQADEEIELYTEEVV